MNDFIIHFFRIYNIKKNKLNEVILMIITVTSGKGGVGKSTTSTNIGVGLAQQGKKVLLMDLDTGMRKLDIFLGLQQDIIYDVLDVIKERCTFREAVIRHKKYKTLYFLATSQVVEKDAIKPQDIVSLCNKIKSKFDYIIIDCPAGIEEGFKCSIAPCDLAIVVVVPEKPSIRDADRVIGCLNKSNKKTAILINKIDKSLVKRGDMLDICDIDDILRVEALGIIPFDKMVGAYTGKGRAIIEDRKSPAGKAFNDTVLRILGKNIPIPVSCKESIWTKIKKLFIWRTANSYH